MTKTKPRRKKKLIQPGFQLRLIAKFVGLAALALLLQFLLLGYLLSEAVQGLEEVPGQLVDELPAMVLKTLGFSFLVLVPVLFGIGVFLTFHIAGPVYRFESYLHAVARGERPGPCRIRDGDELQSLCDAINVLSEQVAALTGESGEPGVEGDAALPADGARSDLRRVG